MIHKQTILRLIIGLLVLTIVPLAMGNRGCWGQKMVDYDYDTHDHLGHTI